MSYNEETYEEAKEAFLGIIDPILPGDPDYADARMKVEEMLDSISIFLGGN